MKPSEALGKADRDAIIRIVEENTCRNPRVFGSVARGEDTEGSDLDLLVDRTAVTGLFKLARIRRTLRELLGVDVDVITSKGMPRHLEESIMRDARPL